MFQKSIELLSIIHKKEHGKRKRTFSNISFFVAIGYITGLHSLMCVCFVAMVTWQPNELSMFKSAVTIETNNDTL